MRPYRVMQVTETGEEFNAFEGDTQEACEAWIEANADSFEESTFYWEETQCPDLWDGDETDCDEEEGED